MARPRKPAKRAQRDHKAAYARRDARAKAAGYKSYYDYRLHRYGSLPAAAPVPTGAARRKLAGKAGRAAFLASLGEGDLIIMPHGLSSVEFDPDARGGEGAYLEIVKLVIDGETGADRTYILRNLTRDELIDTIEEEERRGAIFSPAPSLDQRRLVSY